MYYHSQLKTAKYPPPRGYPNGYPNQGPYRSGPPSPNGSQQIPRSAQRSPNQYQGGPNGMNRGYRPPYNGPPQYRQHSPQHGGQRSPNVNSQPNSYGSSPSMQGSLSPNHKGSANSRARGSRSQNRRNNRNGRTVSRTLFGGNDTLPPTAPASTGRGFVSLAPKEDKSNNAKNQNRGGGRGVRYLSQPSSPSNSSVDSFKSNAFLDDEETLSEATSPPVVADWEDMYEPTDEEPKRGRGVVQLQASPRSSDAAAFFSSNESKDSVRRRLSMSSADSAGASTATPQPTEPPSEPASLTPSTSTSSSSSDPSTDPSSSSSAGKVSIERRTLEASAATSPAPWLPPSSDGKLNKSKLSADTPAFSPESHPQSASSKLPGMPGFSNSQEQHEAALAAAAYATTFETGVDPPASSPMFPSSQGKNEELLSNSRLWGGPSGTEKVDLIKNPSYRWKMRELTDEIQTPQINQLSLPYDTPIIGCPLRPYVSVRKLDGTSEALTQAPDVKARVGANFQWMRGQRRICAVCSTAASLQCLTCAKLHQANHGDYKELPPQSVFCSASCMQANWSTHHQQYHASGSIPRPSEAWQQNPGKDGLHEKFPILRQEAWSLVSRTRKYTPTDEDMGCPLLLEVAPFVLTDSHVNNGQSRFLHGDWTRRETTPVQSVPDPPPPRQMRVLPSTPTTTRQPFTVYNYNVLAQVLATQRMYPYTKGWALAWHYRKKLILRDILQSGSDIIALQEVQANHYETFFRSELARRGYKGVFKRKTREASGEESNFVDGCAIFFRSDRYTLRENYALELDELARQHTGKRRQLRRLIKGNVGMFIVLEDRSTQRLLCVANVHTYWNPEFADVKLWQTWILCQELEKLVVARSLPLLLCGDFNSMPDSAVYELLASSHVAAENPIFSASNDPERLLPESGRMSHGLGLRSVYHSVLGREHGTTNFTEKFSGVLDYIWFSKSHFAPMACLDVDSLEVLQHHTALPSPLFPSDHISLVCQLDWL